jgi:hypothetical protein
MYCGGQGLEADSGTVRFGNVWEIFEQLSICWFLKEDYALWSLFFVSGIEQIPSYVNLNFHP